ncbi:MAG TPA: KEOPS complex subunit Pcc1 [Candidatus Nitrosocosmicus sp.]|nr:KEOPS complex subunit Pcc1 [Candidatus Nitrosocosmicus sp.]
MESFKAKIFIYFEVEHNNHDTGFFPSNSDDGDIIKKPLNSIFVALKGDIQSTPDFDTNVTVSIENNYIILSISGNNMSKFRASLLSFLRLVDLAYSVLYIDK